MTLDDFKNALWKERQGIDALATTVKQNMASILAIAATLAIPAVPAIFAANGMYNLTDKWTETWRTFAALAVAVGIEGAGLFLSQLATKTYSAWRKGAASLNEVWAIAGAVIVYTIIAIALISFSDVPTALKLVVGFIPILGIAFYIGMGFETDLQNRLDEQAAEKRKKKEEQREKYIHRRAKNDATGSRVPRLKMRDVALNILRENPGVSGAQLGEQLGRSKRTGQNLINEFELAGLIVKNGSDGWKVK